MDQEANRNTAMPAPPMITSEVLEYLSISRRTLDKLVEDGKLNPNKRGRRWYFNPDEVAEYAYGTSKV